MIFKALSIIRSELDNYMAPFLRAGETVVLDNIAMLESASAGPGNSPGSLSGKVILTLVGLHEEKTLKNLPHYKKENQQTVYKNPPVHLNLYLLIVANSETYESSLRYLSHIIRFFQGKNTFTHKNTGPPATSAEENSKAFKLVLDLYSPSFEEANYVWSTLGGKQLPAAFYKIRITELEREQIQSTGGLITEIEIDSKSN